MARARRHGALAAGFTLVVGLLALLPTPSTAHAPVGQAGGPTLPTGFADATVIGNVSEATSVAFAPDGTAFVALKTGVIKSFDYDGATGQFEGNGTSTNFADRSENVATSWDRGRTETAPGPQVGTAGSAFVYVTYTDNRAPRDGPPVVPRW